MRVRRSAVLRAARLQSLRWAMLVGMRQHLPFSTLLFACGGIIACGGTAVIDAEPGDGASGGAGAMASSANNTSSSTSTGGGSSGGSIQAITLDKALASVNCQPGGPGGGELDLAFSVSFENVSDGAVVIEIVQARIEGMAGQTSFFVTPDAVVVAASATGSFDFVKSSPGLGISGCDWCTPTDTNLELETLVDGVPRTFTDSIDSVSCVF